jgi:hypothetical protein
VFAYFNAILVRLILISMEHYLTLRICIEKTTAKDLKTGKP